MDSLLLDCHAILLQGVILLRSLDGEAYRRKHPNCFNGSVGGHLRHALDHYWSLLRGLASGEIDYDARVRDTSIEKDPVAASQACEEIAGELKALDGTSLDSALRVKMDCGSRTLPEEEWSRSSLRRELQFLLSHTVHHYALISVMCQSMGVSPQPGFGVAPSTLKYQQAHA